MWLNSTDHIHVCDACQQTLFLAWHSLPWLEVSILSQYTNPISKQRHPPKNKVKPSRLHSQFLISVSFCPPFLHTHWYQHTHLKKYTAVKHSLIITYSWFTLTKVIKIKWSTWLLEQKPEPTVGNNIDCAADNFFFSKADSVSTKHRCNLSHSLMDEFHLDALLLWLF